MVGTITHPSIDLEITEERVESNGLDKASLPFNFNDDEPNEDEHPWKRSTSL